MSSNVVRINRAQALRMRADFERRSTVDAEAAQAEINEVSEILAEEWRRLDSEQVAALKLRADIGFKLLNKVMPDLSSVRIDTPVEEDEPEQERAIDVKQFSRTELQTILAGELAKRGTGEAES